MNHYHTSVQGVCLLKKLNIPDLAIYLIRKYVNFAVDITGYKKRDLLGFLKKEKNINIYASISRSTVIDYLHKRNIIITPLRKKQDKYEEICNLFINKCSILDDKIVIYLKNNKTLEWYYQNGFVNIYNKDYTACITFVKRINKNRIKCTVLILDHTRCYEHLQANTTMYIWSFLFLLFNKFMDNITSCFQGVDKKYMDIMNIYNHENNHDVVISCLEYIYHGVETMNKYKLNYAYTKRPPITYIRMNIYLSYFFLEDTKRDQEIADAFSE